MKRNGGARPAIVGELGSVRKAALPAAIGNGIIWTFSDRGLVIPVSSSLLIWNWGAGANSVLNGYIEWEE